MLLIIGIGVIPIGEDQGEVGQVGERADRAGVPLGRVVELRVLLDGRDLPVRGDDRIEVEDVRRGLRD